MMLRITFLCAIATGSLTAQGSRDLLDDPRPAVVVKRTVHDSNAEPRKPTNKPLVLPLRQITELQGAMPASLTGFGLVTGLDKTGSGSKVTRQAIVNFIRRHGLNPELEDVVPGSTALVAVSAQLPAFSKVGMPLDVHVTALGDEKELRGARLLPVQLRGWDGKVYAIADGPVSVNGFKATIGQTSVSKNHVTAGSISGGGRVVREIPSSFLSRDGFLELRLRNPSVSSSIAAADGINKLLAKTEFRALPVDGYMIRISMPNRLQSEDTAIRLLNRIGNVQVPVQVEAKVIINETSGLIIAGENVQISPCVLALSSLTITVVSEDEVVQPLPGISNAETAIVPRTNINIHHQDKKVRGLSNDGATVGELLANLKAVQLDPQELIEVFKHLKAMGYLHAELVTR